MMFYVFVGSESGMFCFLVAGFFLVFICFHP